MIERETAPINEAVGFLDMFAPKRLINLRQELPKELHPLLVPGGLAGPSDELLLARAAVARAALDEVGSRCAEGILLAERRLKLSRRVRLVGEIAAVLGSASVVTATSADMPDWILVSGIVALGGSLAAVVADYAVRLPQEKDTSLFDAYAWLVEARFEGNHISGELQLFSEAELLAGNESMVTELVGRANALCREAHRRLAILLSGSRG